jgi:GDPmannose 4,6-dehydratase
MRILILGVGGQDGSYLSDILLSQGHEVHGLYRRSSVNNLQRIEHIKSQITLHQGDITDQTSILRVLQTVQPDEVYNVADQDHVGWSLETPGFSFDVTTKAVATLLQTILQLGNKSIRVFQPCSSTIFGDAKPPQTETTTLNPQSPYACAKAAALHIVRYYRQVHNLFVSSAILYNHDSIRRGENYLLHYLCEKTWNVACGKQTDISVGNPDMEIDIGFSKDYMEGVISLLRLPKPTDVIFSSGHKHKIKEVIQMFMSQLGCKDYTISQDPSLLRPGKQPQLIGDISKAKRLLSFSPKHSMNDLVSMLLENKRKLEGFPQ